MNLSRFVKFPQICRLKCPLIAKDLDMAESEAKASKKITMKKHHDVGDPCVGQLGKKRRVREWNELCAWLGSSIGTSK